MISEIFGLLSSVDTVGKGAAQKFRVNLNKNRIKSISAYSSNSIFYFPVIMSDQVTPEEAEMVSRMVERVNASFVVACIGLMPFHRVHADDTAAIEDYLSQFHQNLGMNVGTGPLMKKAFGLVDSLPETFNTVPGLNELNDFLTEAWESCNRNNSEYVKILADSVSVNEGFNISPVDAKTQVLQEQFMEKMRELDLWGFTGDATDDMFDSEDDDLSDDDEDEYELDDAIEDELDMLEEAAMSADKRNSLSDDQFGLPSQRKFPLNDKKHVRLAVQMFKHCPEKDRAELAGNIKKAANKFNMTLNVGEKTTAYKYLSESSVKEAINSIAFSLEAISENKILSAKNLTKLSTLESKLKKLKNKYVKYLNRYKKKYKENQKKGSKAKLLIRFNNAVIGDPKAFMQQFGKYIKIINKRLKLCKKRREELLKRKGISTNTTKITDRASEVKNAPDAVDASMEEAVSLSDMDIKIVDHCIKSIDESLDAPDDEIFSYMDDSDEDDFDDDEDFDDEDLDSIEDSLLSEATTMRSGHVVLNPKEAKRYNNMNKKVDDAYKSARKASEETRRANQRLESEKKQTERYRTLYQHEKDKNASKQEDNMTRAEKAERDRVKSTDRFDTDFDKSRPAGGINPYRAADAQHVSFKTFDKEIFTDMDMKKANDAVPTFAKASVGFVIDETEEVVTRDVLVGIKSYIHKAPSMELINDVYNCIINKRKFLKFVKFITGEERSLTDLIFGIKELRLDALDAKKGAGEWRSAFKRRKRWANISIPYLMKEYTPNGTVVMTMNEVEYVKSQYGIDIMDPSHVKMIMDADFLLSFVILDQANEVVYVTYDGHGSNFFQYTYSMLGRESNMSQRDVMQLYRALSK